MPQTSTAITAANVVVKLADAGGNLQDISGQANEVNIELDKILGEFYTFSGPAAGRTESKKDGSIDLTAVYSKDAVGAKALFLAWYISGGNRNIQIDVPDSTVGNDRYTAAVKLEKLPVPLKAQEGGPVMLKVSLKADGGITPSVITS